MECLEVSYDGGYILLVIFLCKRWHLPLYTALDNKSHVRTANLKLQKARGILSPICIPTMAVSAALKEEASSFGCQVFRSERFSSRLRLRRVAIPIDSANSKCPLFGIFRVILML